MTEAQKNQVTEAVNGWISETDPANSQNQLCKRSDVAPVILAAIRRGDFTYQNSKGSERSIAIQDTYYYKLANVVGFNFSQQIHFANKNHEKVHHMCRYLQAKQRRGILDSHDSGAGKTYALERYAEQYKNVLYIKATSLMKGKDLIDKIITAINVSPESKSLMAKLDAIARKVIQPGYLIIIDEMESVSPDMWRVIKDIEDATYRKIGFLISGKGVSQEIKTAAIRGKKLMPQIWRRFKSNVTVLTAISALEITEACESNGITNKAVQKYFIRKVEDWAQLNEWIKDVHDKLIVKGQEVTEEIVKELFELN